MVRQGSAGDRRPYANQISISLIDLKKGEWHCESRVAETIAVHAARGDRIRVLPGFQLIVRRYECAPIVARDSSAG